MLDSWRPRLGFGLSALWLSSGVTPVVPRHLCLRRACRAISPAMTPASVCRNSARPAYGCPGAGDFWHSAGTPAITPKGQIWRRDAETSVRGRRDFRPGGRPHRLVTFDVAPAI